MSALVFMEVGGGKALCILECEYSSAVLAPVLVLALSSADPGTAGTEGWGFFYFRKLLKYPLGQGGI